MDELNLFGTVALTEDLPEEGLLRGPIGALIEVNPDSEVEVEFVDKDRSTYAQLALRWDQLMRLHREPQRPS